MQKSAEPFKQISSDKFDLDIHFYNSGNYGLFLLRHES
jgi:hypothetical protein